MLRSKLLGLSRQRKRALQVLADIILIWLALWLAFVVRLGIEELINPLGEHLWLFIAAPLIAIPLFTRFGLYRAVMRYVGKDVLVAIFQSVTLSALLLALAVYWYRDSPAMVPRSLVFNYWWLAVMLIGGLRLGLRQYFLGNWYAGLSIPFVEPSRELPRVAIYGAGAAGNQLLYALRMGKEMRPVAFVDDDSSLARRVIAGLQVYRPRHMQQMIEETGATEILLAIPSASRARRREVLERLEKFPLYVRSVPSYMDLVNGHVKVQDLQEVDIADLLGRDSVAPQEKLLQHCISGQTVMVTGAGGSIGAELCRQIVTLQPNVLILFEHSEFNLYSIHRELEQRITREGQDIELIPILGSIRNPARLLDVMQRWSVDTVYHAAAYKHVPLVEHNTSEGLLNNVIGTVNTAQAAVQSGVKHFVLISTDKAVRPTNIMGSTKRLAEMVLQALSHEAAPRLMGAGSSASVHQVNNTCFTMVRFGNVLGSSGSVIPLFREQIKRGGPVTVTHPNITRYFMTIPEAAQLVIQAGSMGLGGDVFVLDMGEPVRIIDLAEKMILLSGMTVRNEENPNGDIAIQFSGLRPGEKLFEELLIGSNVTPTEHPMIMRANEAYLPWETLLTQLQLLEQAAREDDYARFRQLLRELVDGYSPGGDIVDWMHVNKQ